MSEKILLGFFKEDAIFDKTQKYIVPKRKLVSVRLKYKSFDAKNISYATVSADLIIMARLFQSLEDAKPKRLTWRKTQQLMSMALSVLAEEKTYSKEEKGIIEKSAKQLWEKTSIKSKEVKKKNAKTKSRKRK